VTRAKSNLSARRVYSAVTDRSTGLICDQTMTLNGDYSHRDSPSHLRRIRFKEPESGKTLIFLTNKLRLAGQYPLRALQSALADRVVLQVDQAASSD
jgi:hypothetical protein